MSAYFIGNAVGVFAHTAIIAAIFFRLYRGVSPFWARSSLSGLSAFALGALLTGFGRGEGGFEARMINSLSGDGFAPEFPGLALFAVLLGLFLLWKWALSDAE